MYASFSQPGKMEVLITFSRRSTKNHKNIEAMINETIQPLKAQLELRDKLFLNSLRNITDTNAE